MREPTLRSVTILLCSLCLGGAGGECHVPGCALYGNRAPDLPLNSWAYDDHGEVGRLEIDTANLRLQAQQLARSGKPKARRSLKKPR